MPLDLVTIEEIQKLEQEIVSLKETNDKLKKRVAYLEKILYDDTMADYNDDYYYEYKLSSGHD